MLYFAIFNKLYHIIVILNTSFDEQKKDNDFHPNKI